MRVLVLSTTTGYQLRSFVDAAERMGIEAVIGSDRCRTLDDPWRDGAIAVRFYEDARSLETILAAARARPIDGVIAVGDRPTVLAARVAHALGLPGNPVSAAEASRNKQSMRRAFAAAGLAVPWVVELPPDEEPEAALSRVRFPCVVKPLTLSASRGVIKADDPVSFASAVRRIRALFDRPQLRAQRAVPDRSLLVEGYIEGREYAVEGVVTRGALRPFAIFDKPDPLDGPFFEETIYVTPPDLDDTTSRAIVGEVQRAAAALGLEHGPVHAECRVSPHGVVMLEIAARPIGGLCSQVLQFEDEKGRRVPLEEVLLRHVVGEDVSGYRRESQAAGVMMIPIPRRGFYKGVAHVDAARAVPGVEWVEITAKRDQVVEPLPEGDSYLGFIFARAPTSEDVVTSLRAAHGRLAFQIDLQPPIVAG